MNRTPPRKVKLRLDTCVCAIGDIGMRLSTMNSDGRSERESLIFNHGKLPAVLFHHKPSST